MNRRRLLAMLPILPVVLAVSASPLPVQAEPEPIDTRVSYRMSDYVLFEPEGCSNECRACGEDHVFWSHGCRPVAFRPSLLAGWPGRMVAVTPDAVPYAYASGLCAFNNNGAIPAPHQHHDFRWVD
jgi:hypothetical protein